MADATSDPATLAFYDAEAASYAARWTQASDALDRFVALLTPGARILELGCGGGRDAAAMIARGFEVDATDGSAVLAAEAERRLGYPVRSMRFDELTATDTYDGVWANACLLHVPRPGLVGILTRIWRALRPGGVHAASYKVGSGEGRDRLGRYYNRFDVDELVAVYHAAGAWEDISLELFGGAGYDGAQSTWAGLMMRRRTSRE